MIDTHAHLEACADRPTDVLARARAAGVERVVAIGSGLEAAAFALELAHRESGVFAALGIHPHAAAEPDADRLDALRDLLEDDRAVAVGEIGLDFYRDYAPRPRQLKVFEAQLALAEQLGLPAIVHTRAADRETLTALERFDNPVVLHCFSSPPLLEPALERGYYLSFAGNVTYPSAGELRAAAARAPADRILAETDSPYLSPQPRRGRPNEPANVVHTLAVLAEARGEDAIVLERRIEANAARALALP